MKRDDLSKLGIAEDLIEKVMSLYGQGIEKLKAANDAQKAELDLVRGQLGDATKAIDGFKAMNVDQIKAAADEWKTKAEAAEKAAAEQVAQLRFEHALSSALADAKVRDVKSVKAHLDLDGLKLNDDGNIVGLQEQLTKIKTSNDYLFETTSAPPKIVAGSAGTTTKIDPIQAAARIAAGLSTSGDK